MELPEGTIGCAAGDHIIERTDSHWRVWLVQDLVALRRLQPFESHGRIVGVMDALVASGWPPYHDEVYLLLTAFADEFASRDAAADAIVSNSLGEAFEGVCRNIARFPAATCEVIRRSDG